MDNVPQSCLFIRRLLALFAPSALFSRPVSPPTSANISQACLPTTISNDVCFSHIFGTIYFDLIRRLHRLTEHVALSYCMPLFTAVTSTATMGNGDWLHELPVMPRNSIDPSSWDCNGFDLPTSEPGLSCEVG